MTGSRPCIPLNCGMGGHGVFETNPGPDKPRLVRARKDCLEKVHLQCVQQEGTCISSCMPHWLPRLRVVLRCQCTRIAWSALSTLACCMSDYGVALTENKLLLRKIFTSRTAREQHMCIGVWSRAPWMFIVYETCLRCTTSMPVLAVTWSSLSLARTS